MISSTTTTHMCVFECVFVWVRVHIIIIIIIIYPCGANVFPRPDGYFIFLELFANRFIVVSFVNMRDSMLLYIYIYIYMYTLYYNISEIVFAWNIKVAILFSKKKKCKHSPSRAHINGKITLSPSTIYCTYNVIQCL
jgi:hypothetical protein